MSNSFPPHILLSPWDRKESDTTKQLHFYLQKKQNKTKHSPGVFTHDKTIFYLGVKYLCTVEGVQDRHLKVCCFGVLIILSWRYLKHSPYRESSLNSPICLKTDSPKGIQLSQIPTLGVLSASKDWLIQNKRIEVDTTPRQNVRSYHTSQLFF